MTNAFLIIVALQVGNYTNNLERKYSFGRIICHNRPNHMKVLRSPLLVFSTLLTPLLGIAIAPTVHDNGRVTIQIDAPEAKRVQIDIKGRTHDENNQQPFDMIRSKDGQWSFTSSPLDPGFHYYFLFLQSPLLWLGSANKWS
jgi:hypothetical protein